jgi:hypothetical protein
MVLPAMQSIVRRRAALPLASNRFGPDPLAEVEDNSASSQPAQTSWDQQSELEFVPPSASPPGGMRVKPGYE